MGENYIEICTDLFNCDWIFAKLGNNTTADFVKCEGYLHLLFFNLLNTVLKTQLELHSL